MVSGTNILAIHGGKPVRSNPMPTRRQFDKESLRCVQDVFEKSWDTGQDFGFQGAFEEGFCEAYSDFQGGGHADLVCSGTVALLIAVSSLNLPTGSEILVSPITSPGSVSPLAKLGFKITVVDSDVTNPLLLSASALYSSINKSTSAVVVTHAAGYCADMKRIMEIAREWNLKVIEDCSQSPGAAIGDKRVGSFGDVSATSTMYTKSLSTGGTGGVVYTKNAETYREIRLIADRGKPFYDPKFTGRDSDHFIRPELNFNLDEISAALGILSLKRLPSTNSKRKDFADKLDKALKNLGTACQILPYTDNPAFYYLPITVDLSRLTCSKYEFGTALAAEGIPVNPDYREVVTLWPWIKPWLSDANQRAPVAEDFIANSFNLSFNENYGDRELQDIVESISKLEKGFHL